MRAPLLVLLAVATIAFASSVPHVIGGDFTSVDSVSSPSLAAFRFPSAAAGVGDLNRYPDGQFLPLLGAAPQLIAQAYGPAFAEDGSAVASDGSELYYFSNDSSQYATRLFGFNGFFGWDDGALPNGQNPRTDNSYYTDLIQGVQFLGSTPNRQLLVCVGSNGAHERLIVGSTALPNPSTTTPPTPLQNQLLLFSEGETFFSEDGFINTPSNAAPVDITPTYTESDGTDDANAQPGVLCWTLQADGTSAVIQTASAAGEFYNGPYYYASDVTKVTPNTWEQITRDPNNGTYFEEGYIYLLGGAGGSENIYWYGTNPSNKELDVDDSYNTIYRWTGSTNWTPVISPVLMQNLTIDEYVVGSGGDTEIYFTLYPINTGGTAPAPLNNDALPVENYIFIGGTQGINYLAPLSLLLCNNAGSPCGENINLYYDTNYDSLVVYAYALSGVVVGDQVNYISPEQDHLYYSKQLNKAAFYDKTSDSWVPAYGGGFDGAVGIIFSAANGVTYLTGSFNFAYQRFTGPVALFDSNLGAWSYAYGATVANVDIDGGDFHGIFNSYAVVFDVAPFEYQGVDGLLVAGQYRTADQGNVACNSLCFFPSNGGGKISFSDSPASAFYNATGVRAADAADAVVIPEHSAYFPGTIFSVVTDSSSSNIYVGGSFNIAGNKAASSFAIYTAVASKNFAQGWSNAAGGVYSAGGTAGAVYSMVLIKDVLYVAGSFSAVGTNIKANNIAGFNTRTRQWFSLNYGLDDIVYKVVEWEGKLLAVGSFYSGSGQELGNTGVWNGKAWSPLNSKEREINDCSYGSCFANDLGENGIHDVFVHGNTPYFLVTAYNGHLTLIKYIHNRGFVSLDNEDTFTTTTADSYNQPGASFISTSPWNKHALDLWNIESDLGEANIQAKYLVTYNTKTANFENPTATGVSGDVFAILPKGGASSAAFHVASAVLVTFAVLFAILF